MSALLHLLGHFLGVLVLAILVTTAIVCGLRLRRPRSVEPDWDDGEGGDG